jgi:DNA-binding response OmpR family regulator
MTKILLLSQSKSLLNSLNERLRFENFMTDEVDNCQTATEMCRDGKFDVVITRKPNTADTVNLYCHT